MYKRHNGQVSMLESPEMFGSLPLDPNNEWIKLSDPAFVDLNWPIVEKNELFSFGNSDFDEQEKIAESAKKISISELFKIMGQSLFLCDSKPRSYNEVHS